MVSVLYFKSLGGNNNKVHVLMNEDIKINVREMFLGG